MSHQEVVLAALADENWPKLEMDAGGARLVGSDGVVHYLTRPDAELFILGWAKAKGCAS